MSEYNVTKVAQETEGERHCFSGSVAELGNDAGQFTWNNCLDLADEIGEALALDPDDARDHFRAYGAWDDAEIEAWTERELQALVIQETAAGLRDIEHEDFNQETDGGNVWEDDSGQVWIYLGH